MSNTPTVPAATPAAISGELSKISTYIKAHEKLIVIILLISAGIFAYQKAAGIIERHDQRTSDLAHATLQAQIDTVKAQAAINATAAQQYQDLAARLGEANAALANAINERSAVTAKQQAVDKTLSPSDLGNRWATLLHLTPGKIVYKATGAAVDTNIDAFLVAPDAAVATTVALESIPSLEANLVDQTTTTANLKEQLTNLGGVNDGLNRQIVNLNGEIVKQTKACTDDKNLLKAQARKSKLKYLLFGGAIVEGIKLYFFHTL